MDIASLLRTGVWITLAVVSVSAIDTQDAIAQRPRSRSSVLARDLVPAPQEEAIDSPSDRAVPRRLPKSPESRPEQAPPGVPQPPRPANAAGLSVGPVAPAAPSSGSIAGQLSVILDNGSEEDRESQRPAEKSLRDISLDITASAGSVPPNAAAKHYATTRVIHDPRSRGWGEEVYLRETPRFYHNPLYFDQPLRERGGQDRFPKLGPAVSGAQFFVHSVSLPYQMALDPPHALQPTPPRHSVGTPWHRRHSAQDHGRAAVVQAAAIALAIWLIP